jgi:divalent metal cation (Fe/Co/Zn/Cd) transporter
MESNKDLGGRGRRSGDPRTSPARGNHVAIAHQRRAHYSQRVTTSAEAVRQPPSDAERDRLVRRARLLAWSSLAWMTAEGAIAIVAGIAAGSIALIGFGIDSAIEGIASVVIIWRFWGKRALSEAAERRAQKLVAVQFFILAPYIAIEAVRTLVTSAEPDVSRLGIALTAVSVLVMPYFGVAKRRVGARLGSAATSGEGMQNFLCAYLSVAVLAGLTLNASFGWWWADPLAALVIAGVAVREGLESWRGEECC